MEVAAKSLCCERLIFPSFFLVMRILRRQEILDFAIGIWLSSLRGSIGQ